MAEFSSCVKSYNRVILKLSGEALKSSKDTSIDLGIVNDLVSQVKSVVALGVEVGIVIGGGNIFRGVSVKENKSLDRVTGDYMGMLATVINGLALQNALERSGVPARIQVAFDVGRLAEPFVLGKTLQYFDSKKVVVFVGGTGNPFFSTDTAAALRASEVKADVIMKATQVDGVYSDDPKKNDKAEFYPELTYSQVLAKQLKVMDATAISLCMESKIPILVFNIAKDNNILNAVIGKKVGTIIRG